MCGCMASALGSCAGGVDLHSFAAWIARAAWLRMQMEMREMRQGVLKILTANQKEKEREQLQQEVCLLLHHLGVPAG